MRELVDLCNRAPAPIIAIDVPSGIGDTYRPGDPAIQAAHTLTVGAHKLSLYLPGGHRCAGQITLIPIEYPRQLLEDTAGDAAGDAAELITDDALARLYTPLTRDAYKLQRGVVYVHGGSPGMPGAPILAADAAAACGAGMLYLDVEENDTALYAAARPAYLLLRPHRSTVPAHRANAHLFGPGWTESAENQKLLLETIGAHDNIGVIDATALRVLAAAPSAVNCAHRWLLTPHIGELAALLHTDTAHVLPDPLGSARRAAQAFQTTVLVKSHISYICAPDGRAAIFDGTHPAIGCAGSGDVLAGIAAALLARAHAGRAALAGHAAPAGRAAHAAPPPDLFAIAKTAALLHHRAALTCYQEHGFFRADHLPGAAARVCADLQP